MKDGVLSRPFGTGVCFTAIPALKRWAILVSSLRDDSAQFLVPLGEAPVGSRQQDEAGDFTQLLRVTLRD